MTRHVSLLRQCLRELQKELRRGTTDYKLCWKYINGWNDIELSGINKATGQPFPANVPPNEKDKKQATRKRKRACGFAIQDDIEGTAPAAPTPATPTLRLRGRLGPEPTASSPGLKTFER